MGTETVQSNETVTPSQGNGKVQDQSNAKGKSDDASATVVNDEVEVIVDRSAEDYAKRLKETSLEAKKFRQENAELKRRLDEAEAAKLTEQGNFKEIAEKAQKKAAELEKELKSTKGSFAFKSVSNQVATEALRLGCIDTDALIKLTDLSDLEVKEDYSVEPDSIKSLLDAMVKTKPFLFKKADPKISDGLPPGRGTGGGGKKELKDLTLEEKMALLDSGKLEKGASVQRPILGK